MIISRTIYCLSVIIIFLVGCAGVSGGNWMGINVSKDAGTMPNNYEETAKQCLMQRLKDPDSLKQFSVGNPSKTSCSIGIYGPFWGWCVQVNYNAKNSFGGYVGLQTKYFWFHGENVVAITDNPTFCPSIKAERVNCPGVTKGKSIGGTL